MDFLVVLLEHFSLGVTAESLRAKRDRKSATSLQRGQFDPKFQVQGSPPPIIFAPIIRLMNALQLCPDRNFAAGFLQVKCDFGRKLAICVFETPFGDLGATYDVRFGFIGKRVVDFLLVLTELFSIGVKAEALQANIGSK